RIMHIAMARRFGIRGPRIWIYCLIVAVAAATLAAHPARAQTRTIPLITSPSDPPFWRDAEWDLHPRTYYFDRHNFNGSIAQAWAGGGWIGWQSGFIHEVFQFGATLY